MGELYYVTCDVGDASSVVIGRFVAGEYCRNKSVHFHWFCRARLIAYPRHSQQHPQVRVTSSLYTSSLSRVVHSLLDFTSISRIFACSRQVTERSA